MTVCFDVAALQFLRRTEDVSADIEEMETEMQGSDDGAVKSPDGPVKFDVAVEDEAESLKKNGDVEKKQDDENFTMRHLLRSRQLRLPLFIAMFLQVIQQLSGINAVRHVQCRLQYNENELIVTNWNVF